MAEQSLLPGVLERAGFPGVQEIGRQAPSPGPRLSPCKCGQWSGVSIMTTGAD